MSLDLLFIGIVIIWIIIGTSYLRWHPFFVLLISALGLAMLLQTPLIEIPKVISVGFGSMFENIGLLILFGSFIGAALEATHATQIIAETILQKFRRLPLPFVVSGLGYIVSIPVFCDAAFVILAPLTKKMALGNHLRRNGLTIALSTGLFSAHVLVPPTPGPLAAAANLKLENLYLLLLGGGFFALILMLIGAFYAYYLFRKAKFRESLTEMASSTEPEQKTLQNLNFRLAIIPLALPILLMALAAFTPFFSRINVLHFLIAGLEFLGDPIIALLVGVLTAFYLCLKQSISIHEVIEKGIRQAAPILLITAMGGALGSVIQQANLTQGFENLQFNASIGLAIPFFLAAVLKSAQGSSTVALITVSSILLPLLPALGLDSEAGKVWAILAIGAGSVTVSHANDSYFWIVSQLGEMSVKEAYRTHTFATFLQGLVGFILLLFAYNLWGA
ncbi:MULTISPECIES: GntP family permease [unclassified Leeuwenhoekiella]|uniref:GntP family permease n=1 Tax=unclassified Leeuwenhoekiella TaxID=2615029 RepID=UPI000C465B1F|nr:MULTISPECIES: GntP family permease [unclassified Leeuwenhoekiella]MAW93948.1 permease [Leeuwenhoekiella sp.]MBA81013.1 permease [Leeuwenhoekiella sp.]|tara:strand:- start:5026 stop:6369 length:1344 start_codon:yes stop_codon:yes gene_type:complete